MVESGMVNLNTGRGTDTADVGLGTLVFTNKARPTSHRAGSTPSSDNITVVGRANGSANLGNGTRGFAEATIPVEVERAVRARKIQELLGSAQATVGVKDKYSTVSYTKGSDFDTLRYNGQNKRGGLGLNYTKTSDGNWQANADIMAKLGKKNLNLGLAQNSHNVPSVRVGFNSGNFNMGGDINSRGDYNVRANVGYRF